MQQMDGIIEESQDSKNFTKILDFVRSQNPGLDTSPDIEVDTRNAFDCRNIPPLREGEDPHTHSNFFSLLSKALPIEQINVMLQQELDRRKKALSSYEAKCNEAEYLLPKLVSQETALNAKLRGLTEDIKMNSERLERVNSEVNCHKVEQVGLDKQIDEARRNVEQMKRKLDACDKLQDNLGKLCNTGHTTLHTQNLNTSSLDPTSSLPSIQPTENSSEIHLQESSLTTDNISFISSTSPAKSHTSENLQLPSISSESVSIKNEISLSEGEIVDDSECGSVSESNSEIDDTDEI